ncbi:MAG: hypothetical protein P9L92_19735 [Candidatus Electryonea clarkiae]|nr:hypothetical protein [Candidatus Electryonea clarkiae]MDP8287233.1 hypothetical protein [Candidatus Electryonea clarkiae]
MFTRKHTFIIGLSLISLFLLSGQILADIEFTQHDITTNFTGASACQAFDIDGDDDLDVVGVAIVLGDVTWWENDGAGDFEEHTIDDNFTNGICVHATDVDIDGDVDVIAGTGG